VKAAFFLLVLILFGTGCGESPKKKFVVLYTSQDQFYAEPILKEFTERTGIEVRSVFDTESAKTAGLAHRLEEFGDDRLQVVAGAEGFENGLALMNDIHLPGYYLLPAARADLLRRLGRNTEAERAYREALILVQNESARRYLERRLASVVGD